MLQKKPTSAARTSIPPWKGKELGGPHPREQAKEHNKKLEAKISVLEKKLEKADAGKPEEQAAA